MRFNHRELAVYASSRQGKADKEGCLWVKEWEGIIFRKKETYTQRWFLLTGNLLFYSRTEHPDSVVVGLIILERCRVEVDNESGNRNAFRLLFEDGYSGYSFVANSAKDQDEWTTALNSGSYEYLRLAFSELRGQLMHLTGRDPLVEDHPLGALPVKSVSSVPASAPAYEGDPVFELSLACSSLVGSLRDGVPSALIVTSCMTPPQAYWIRYAQTEVIEHNCDPRFFTTVVFYMGSVSMATQLKFEVFDVYDRRESKMCPIGQAQSQVMELIRAPGQSQRLEVNFNGGICGYLHVRAWRSQEGEVLSVCPLPTSQKRVESGGGKDVGASGEFPTVAEETSSFSFRAPMDNIVIRTFHFPITDSDKQLKVTEVMGESKYSFILPMQLLNLYIAEENATLSQYATLTGLREDWEIARQEVMLEHSTMVSQYRENCSGLQAQLEAGVTFKKSTSKGQAELEFVPVNLHIQEMKVAVEESSNKDKVMYTAVTAGCPTAYGMKYRQGGLARTQVASLAGVGNFTPSSENKTFRAKALLSRLEKVQCGLRREVERLRDAAREMVQDRAQMGVRSLADYAHQLGGHCNVALVNDALRDLHGALEDPSTTFSSLTELNAGALCHKVEEHVLCVEAQVEAITRRSLVHTEDWLPRLERPLQDLLTALDEVGTILKKALYFLLMKESNQLMLDKHPIGLKSYKHRRDIVFSQAVTTVVTSFVFRVLQSAAVGWFLTQLQEVGFLVHWESLLSTHGDEIGMLEDFIIAIHDLNHLCFKITLAGTMNDTPRVTGSRYKVLVEVPVQKTLFRVLPATLQAGSEIGVCVVLFTQGVNELQSLADTFGDNTLQDHINARSLEQLSSYCTRYKEHFGSASARLTKKTQKAFQLLNQLRQQVHAKKAKNVDILSLSQELCRTLDCGRITSCKSAKDRTGMSVTLEQVHILMNEMQMDTGCFQQALDAMRSQGTRLRNTEKNVGVSLYAFNALQVFALPPPYRPPEGTYKKLQT